MLRRLMSRKKNFVLDVAAWAAFHAATGYAAHRLREEHLAGNGWLLRRRAFERDGRWYRDTARIHEWKDLLPEAGDLFPGGISKRHLPGTDEPGLRQFAEETRRAELGHWWALCCGPVFVLWNAPLASTLLVGYGVVVNAPFIVVQRYNRFRTLDVIERRFGP